MAQIKKHAPDLGSHSPTWHQDAACRDLGEADVFFPHAAEQEKNGVGYAKAYCDVCPVRLECLKAALDGNEFGTWGGMTQFERQALKSRANSKAWATLDALQELLEVTVPQCLDCGRHRKEKQDGRCAECHRTHLKAEAARVKALCSMDDCDAVIHAKGKCTKHYHADLRASKPDDGPARSRKSRAKVAA